MPRKNVHLSDSYDSIGSQMSFIVRSPRGEMFLTVMYDRDLVYTILENIALKWKHIIMGVMPFKIFKPFQQHIMKKKSEIKEWSGVMVHHDTHLIRTAREGSLISQNRCLTNARNPIVVRYLHCKPSRGSIPGP